MPTSLLKAASCSMTPDRASVNLEITLVDSGPHLLLSGSQQSNSLPAGLPTTLFNLLVILEKFHALSLSSAATL